MRGRARLAAALIAAACAVAGCATFPDTGPRNFRPQVEGAGELGKPPRVAEPTPDEGPSASAPAPSPDAEAVPRGCVDPDPAVVATCLGPVGAVAVLPDGESALVAERLTGRILRVKQNEKPVLVTTVPADGTGGGGLTGLVLSPGYAEDHLVYAYVTTPADNRVVKIAPREGPKPVLTGIPRGAAHNGGALAVDVDGSLLVATGDAGAPGVGLGGVLLRIDTLGRPAGGNPNAGSPVLSTGLTAPGGICVDQARTTVWITDRTPEADVLHLVQPGALPSPAWRWPDRPGVAGCAAGDGRIVVAETGATATAVLEADEKGLFTGAPEVVPQKAYGRLGPVSMGPDGLTWMGTLNKAGGTPTSSDDRVIRIQVSGGGGSSRS